MSQDLRARVVEVLKTVYDPEIPVNIYELGLIYDVQATTEGGVIREDDADRAQLPGSRDYAEPGEAENPKPRWCHIGPKSISFLIRHGIATRCPMRRSWRWVSISGMTPCRFRNYSDEVELSRRIRIAMPVAGGAP